MPEPLRIGTRGSRLALWQAHRLRDLLAAALVEALVGMDSLAEDVVEMDALAGREVLFPCSERALRTVEEALARAGARVTRLETYRPRPAERGWLDLERVAMKSALSIRRAGADAILTYFAKDLAGWLSE